MPKITYADKSALNQNAGVADINKCNATDLNQIKNVINNTLIETLGLTTNTWSSSGSYDKGDIVVYDSLLYQNLTGNVGNAPSGDTTNWEQTTILIDD